LKIYTSQSSVVTQLIWQSASWKFSTEYASERIIKICQYLAKMWTNVTFLWPMAHCKWSV